MSAQSRIGFVSLILLVGCILAIPHFRHPTGDVDSNGISAEVSDDASSLTLKVEPVTENAAETNQVVVASSTSQLLRDTVSDDRHSLLVQTPVSSPPASLKREEWKFPPVEEPTDAEVAAARASSRFVERTDFADSRPKPVRLFPDAKSEVDQFARRPFQQPPLSQDEVDARSRDSSVGLAERTVRSGGTTQFIARSSVQNSADANTPMRDDDSTALHRIVNGDTLENLAQQYYGDPRKAMLIFESNRQALFNPAILPLGLDLKIPMPTK